MAGVREFEHGYRRRGAVALIAAALLTAGCSSSGSTSPEAKTGSGAGGVPKTIADALRGVHASATTKTDFSYGQYGGASLAPLKEVLPPIIGFNAEAPFVLTVGKPPNEVSVLYGTFDPAAIGAKLQGLGYRQSDRGNGQTQWLIRDDHQFDANQQPEALGMTMSTLNVVRVSKDRIVYGGATADLDAAVPAGSVSLIDDPAVGGIAECLGADASGEFTTSLAVPLAVGVGSDGTETICAAAPDDATAKAYGDTFTKQVASGTTAVGQEPWSKLITDPKVESLGGKAHVMRLTAHSATPGHPHLAQALLNGDLGTLIGLPGPTRKPSPGAGDTSPSISAS